MISVVIAAYNEEGIIRQSVLKTLDYLRNEIAGSWELIVVNDGSADGTGAILDEMAKTETDLVVLHHLHNYGQGRALRTGFAQCHGDVIVTLDADLSYGPQYIKILTGSLKDKRVDIALASAYAKGGTVRNVPYYRLFLSKWGNYYLARMSQYSISTSTCVVRAYRREVIDSLFLTADGMELQLEILMKSAMMNFKVSEEPAELAWDMDKLMEADFGRVSKMRIFRTIALYLKMGWLFRPAYIFIIASLLLLGPGLYMAFYLALFRLAPTFMEHLGSGLSVAVSVSLAENLTKYAYSFGLSAALIIFGFQLFIFGMLMMQSKFYFDELYRLGQQIIFDNRRNREDKK
ncbi:MAG: glycosyltransferase family 2 protein [Nitrospinae bacterium]|nr:glycosyltransferase family 2 protein [Nitrospinota bacterium]